MVYGYARVSTTKQAKRGNSLDEQREALLEAGAQDIITDQYTGTKMDRPNFTELCKKMERGDKLIVTKLDRLARTAIDGGAIVRELHERGITIHILNMGVADNTPMGKLMVTMLLAFAEFERDMIVERTQAGKEIARGKGIRVDGRPKKYSRSQRAHAIDLLENGHSYSTVASMTGISRSTLVRLVRDKKLSGVCPS